MSTPAGVLAKSGSACCAGSPVFPSRRKVPSMRCWIAAAGWSAAVGCVVALKALRYLWGSGPMNCGAPITKASFLLGNHQYCYPLTVTDHASRFLLTCEALSSTKEEYAFTVFERLFKERGLPANIRSDNGVPFASAHALFNLSKLAVWWLRPGIGIERSKPGHPQQNGRHERMHLTLKKEATKPAVANFLQQQARFDKFIEVFNNERPHEARDMKCPAEVYQPSRVPTVDCR